MGSLDIVLGFGLKMILFVAIGGLCGVMSGVFANLSAQQFGNDIRKDAFKRIMTFSFEQTDRFSTGSLITRVTNDITQLQNFVMQCMRGFVRTSMLFIGGIVCMIGLNMQFGVVIACALPFIIVCVVYFIAKSNPKFTVLQKKLDRLNNVMQENVSSSDAVFFGVISYVCAISFAIGFAITIATVLLAVAISCLLYTSPSPRD